MRLFFQGRWLAQTLHWCTMAVLARLCVFACMFAGHYPLALMARELGAWACTVRGAELKLWLSVVIVPAVADAVQLLVQNVALRANSNEVRVRRQSDTAAAAPADVTAKAIPAMIGDVEILQRPAALSSPRHV
jgi:hypothetical protein